MRGLRLLFCAAAVDLGVTRLGANAASIFMNLAPVLTAIIAAVFLKEELHSYHIIGGGVVLIGVIMAQRLRTPLTQIIRRKTKKHSRNGVVRGIDNPLRKSGENGT